MFDTVKKQGEQLDGLQQKVSNNTERIETLETRSQATPPARDKESDAGHCKHYFQYAQTCPQTDERPWD